MTRPLFALVASSAIATTFLPDFIGASENWPSWRGPSGGGANAEGEYPSRLDATTTRWKLPLPGKGCSTPVVWEERIYLTGPVAGKDSVSAIDWKGALQWQVSLGDEIPGRHRNGSGANSSPVTDGEVLVALFKSGQLAALDLEGNLLWQTNLVERWGKWELFWDFGTSPLISGSSVIVAVMHGGDSYLVAFDKRNGEQLWKTGRNFETPVENDHSYATPLLAKGKGGEPIVVTWGAEHLTAHRVEDGKLLWQAGGFNPNGKKNWVAVASHVHVGDLALVPYGRGAGLAAYRLDGAARGDITGSHLAWNLHGKGASGFVPSPVVYKDLLYLLKDRGAVACIDPRSGSTLWQNELPRASSSYYASPAVAGDLLYAAREDGVVFVATLGKKGFASVSEWAFDERIVASPVPVAGRLLIRGDQHLYCFGTAKSRLAPDKMTRKPAKKP